MATSERIKEIYTEWYTAASRSWRDLGAVDKSENIVRACRAAALPGCPRVIEIGSGDGAVAAALQRRGFFDSYLGFDFSPSGVSAARSRNVPAAEFVQTSGGPVPVPDDSADLVILCHVVEHLEHPRELLYEARRIAPLVVVEVPLELNARIPRDFVWDNVGHINKYNSTAIRQLVQTCEFDVLTQFTTNPSLAVATFHGGGWKRRAEWRLKGHALRSAPAFARTVFTYHETLLAKRTTPAEQAEVGA